MEMEGGYLEVNESATLLRPAPLDLVPLKKFILQMSWTGAQLKCTTMLGSAMPPRLKPIKRFAESVYEVSVGGKATQKRFPVTASYCSDISEAESMSVVCHGSRR